MKNFITLLVFFILVSFSSVTFAVEDTNSTGSADTTLENTNSTGSIDTMEGTSSGEEKKGLENLKDKYLEKFKSLKDKYEGKLGTEDYRKKRNDLYKEYKNELKDVRGGVRERVKVKGNNVSKRVKNKINYIRGRVKVKREDIIDKVKAKRADLREKFKRTFKIKYGRMISRLDDTKLNKLIERINNLETQILDSDRSDKVKEKFVDILAALRTLAQEQLDGAVDDKSLIDGLFKGLGDNK